MSSSVSVRLRRGTERVPLATRVYMSWDGGWLFGSVLDLSLGGMLVKARQAVPLGTSVRLGFSLEVGNAPPVAVDGRIVRHVPSGLDGDPSFGMQIEFDRFHAGRTELHSLLGTPRKLAVPALPQAAPELLALAEATLADTSAATESQSAWPQRPVSRRHPAIAPEDPALPTARMLDKLDVDWRRVSGLLARICLASSVLYAALHMILVLQAVR
jgi:PilZ domain-containing protein